MKEKYIAFNGVSRTELDADSVSVVAPDGSEVTLQYRRSDGAVCVSIDSVSGRMSIEPRACNLIYITKKRD